MISAPVALWRRTSCNLLLRRRPGHKRISWTRRTIFLRATSSMATGGKGSQTNNSLYTNRLLHEKSPYLLQHAHNPVDWYPWGQEAFDKAKREDKLIFLSVGYSTCHWCHVMEQESFQSEEIGQILNENFVCIKVDREERPDVDKVYMTFVQATSSGGGWPMSVWLTPDLKPFVGGTYFPPEDGIYQVGFRTVLLRILEQWKRNKNILLENSQKILSALLARTDVGVRGEEAPPSLKEVTTRCFQQLSETYDEEYGGFSESPKFPTPVNLNFLFSYWGLQRSNAEGARALQMALHTLKMMAYGGIHDHISQGFHRYSTDQRWHVPHFEKMLYDQGQLAAAYAKAFQISGDEFFADTAADILLYVSRDLSDDSGGFYSAEDADSYATVQSEKKQEGAFCVWTAEEIRQLLPDPVEGIPEKKIVADVFMHHYGMKEDGNVNPMKDPHNELKGKNVLIMQYSLELTAARFGLGLEELKTLLVKSRQKLFKARTQRPRPHLDSKMLASWNGLMISGFAQCGAILGKKEYVDRAVRAASFLQDHMFNASSGKLLRTCYQGQGNTVTHSSVPIHGFLEDYVFVIQALFDLYEATLNPSWLEWAVELQHKQDELFWDPKGFAYFSTEAADPSLLFRMKDDQDGAEPSPNSVAVFNLLRAASYTDHEEWVKKAGQILTVFSERLVKIPVALPEMARATAAFYLTLKQVVICGDLKGEDTRELLHCYYSTYTPNRGVYGTTENSPVTFMGFPQDTFAQKTETVGYILPHTEAKIEDPNTGQIVPLNSAGELQIRGYCVMLGYWADTNKTKEVLNDEQWYKTGDIAILDEYGYCKIVGRCKDMIIRGGENIYPAELEQFLHTHPKIQEVQVVGVKDERFGEEICASIRVKAGEECTADEIKAFCKGKIAHFKIPRYVVFVKDYPLTVSGKIQKYKLRERMEKHLQLQ